MEKGQWGVWGVDGEAVGLWGEGEKEWETWAVAGKAAGS
jgi:hypothetical protein